MFYSSVVQFHIWDFSGQTTQFFMNDEVNMCNDSSRQPSEEVWLVDLFYCHLFNFIFYGVFGDTKHLKEVLRLFKEKSMDLLMLGQYNLEMEVLKSLLTCN